LFAQVASDTELP